MCLSRRRWSAESNGCSAGGGPVIRGRLLAVRSFETSCPVAEPPAGTGHGLRTSALADLVRSPRPQRATARWIQAVVRLENGDQPDGVDSSRQGRRLGSAMSGRTPSPNRSTQMTGPWGRADTAPIAGVRVRFLEADVQASAVAAGGRYSRNDRYRPTRTSATDPEQPLTRSKSRISAKGLECVPAS